MKKYCSKSMVSFVLSIFVVGIIAFACGGGDSGGDSNGGTTGQTDEQKSDAKLLEANAIMESTGIKPDITSLTSGNTNSFLPDPANLKKDHDGDGVDDYEQYEDAISNINTAINLIGAAKKTYEVPSHSQSCVASSACHAAQAAFFEGTSNAKAQAPYVHFTAGYLFTIAAVSRIVNSPLGSSVITIVDGAYTITLPEDTNQDGFVNLGDLDADETKAKQSAQAIIDALYLLTGKEYKISGSIPVGTETWIVDLEVSSRLKTLFKNVAGPSTGLQINHPYNALFQFLRCIDYAGGLLGADVQQALGTIKTYISDFNSQLNSEADQYGIIVETE